MVSLFKYFDIIYKAIFNIVNFGSLEGNAARVKIFLHYFSVLFFVDYMAVRETLTGSRLFSRFGGKRDSRYNISTTFFSFIVCCCQGNVNREPFILSYSSSIINWST